MGDTGGMCSMDGRDIADLCFLLRRTSACAETVPGGSLSPLLPVGIFQIFYAFDLDPVERKALTMCRGEWEAAA